MLKRQGIVEEDPTYVEQVNNFLTRRLGYIFVTITDKCTLLEQWSFQYYFILLSFSNSYSSARFVSC